ncbi:MAG: DUF309 domain-containing protein [Pseudonocardia sp.]|nr:DUF309 domain-containing protein [Pseudonocardia sp.]
MGDRDRDTEGRAHNARPRDAAGRPLSRGAAGLPRVPDGQVLAPAEALDEAQRLLNVGLPFHAHEVLESVWKTTHGAERTLWQGLAQLAVGLTHAQRGNATGAAALLERAAARITAFAADPPHGVDVHGLTAYATETVARIRAGGLASLTEADRCPRLQSQSGRHTPQVNDLHRRGDAPQAPLT